MVKVHRLELNEGMDVLSSDLKHQSDCTSTSYTAIQRDAKVGGKNEYFQSLGRLAEPFCDEPLDS